MIKGIDFIGYLEEDRYYSEIANDILEQRIFDDNSGPGLGTAILGTGLAAGAAFAGAKKGLLGGKARQWAGETWAKAGKTVGSSSMMGSGMKDAAKGSLTTAGKSYAGSEGEKLLRDEMNRLSRKEGMNMAKDANGNWIYKKGGAVDANAAKKTEEATNNVVNNSTNTGSGSAITVAGSGGGKISNQQAAAINEEITKLASKGRNLTPEEKARLEELKGIVKTKGLEGSSASIGEQINTQMQLSQRSNRWNSLSENEKKEIAAKYKAEHNGSMKDFGEYIKNFSSYRHYKYKYL